MDCFFFCRLRYKFKEERNNLNKDERQLINETYDIHLIVLPLTIPMNCRNKQNTTLLHP